MSAVRRNVEVWVVGDSKSAQNAFAEFERAAGKAQSTTERTARSMEATGRTLGKIGTPIAALGGLAAKAFIDFEDGFAGVRKTVDASEAEFAAMADGIRELSREIPISVGEINQIGEAAGQLGIANEHILDFTRVMADLGVATNMTSEEAATAFARFANITQMPQEQFDRLGSTVVALGNNLATTESEIAEMGLRLAGAGNIIGMTEAEILGLGGALSSVGIRAEAGGTAVSKVMINMANAVSQGSDQLDNFAHVAGMTSEEFARTFQDRPAEAIVAFIEGLGQINDAGGDLFGTLGELGISEVRMRDALLRTAGAGELVATSIDLANESFAENVALTDEAQERYGTLASQLTIAKNRLVDAGISVGETLAPAMVAGADAVAGLADAVAAVPTPVTNTVVGLGALAAASRPVLSATASLTRGWGRLTTAIAGARELKVAGEGIEAIGASAVASSRGLGALATIFSPTGVLIAGIAAVAGAALLAKRNVDAMAEAHDSAAEAAPRLADSLGIAYRDIAASAEDAAEGVAATGYAFDQANSRAIEALRGLQSEVDRADYLVQVGWNLTQHGATVDEAFAAVQQLADAAGITLPVDLDADSLADVERQLEAIAGTGARVAEEIEANWLGMGTATKETMSGIAEAAADAFKLDDAETAVRMIAEFEAAISNSTLSTGMQREAINYLNDEFAKSTGVAGWTNNVYNDLADTVRQLGFDVAGAGAENRAFARALSEALDAGYTLPIALARAREAAEQQAAAAADAATATGDAGDAAAGAVGPMGDLADSAGDVANELEEAKSAGEQLKDVIDVLTGANLDLVKTELSWLDSLHAVKEGVEDNGKSLDRSTEKGRRNEQQLIRSIEAAITHANAIAEQSGSAEEGAEALDRMVDKLVEQATAAGLSEEKVRALIDEVNLVPDEVSSRVTVETEEAARKVGDLAALITGIPNEHVTRFRFSADALPAAVRHRFTSPSLPGRTQADGGVLEFYAAGDIRDGHVAQIAPAGAWRVWAEEETGGEAYIPLAPHKRARSLEVWAEAGRRLGVAGLADGGVRGPGLAAGGYYDLTALRGITRQASFGDAAGHLAAIEQLQAAYERMARAIEQRDEAQRRAELVAQQRAAKTAEERRRAADAIKDHDRQVKLAAQQREYAERLAAAQANLRIKQNREQWRFEQMSAEQQLRDLDRRLAGEKKYTDEWLQLARQRQQVQRQIDAERARIEENRQAYRFERMTTEQQLRELERRLAGEKKYTDEWMQLVRQRDQLQQQVTDAERQRLQQIADAQREAAERIREAIDDRIRTLSSWRELAAQPDGGPWGADAATLIENIDAQTAALAEWGAELDRLRGRGLSDGVVDALGLAESPDALNQIRALLEATTDEIDELNRAYLDRVAQIDRQVAAERDRAGSGLADAIADIERDVASRIAGGGTMPAASAGQAATTDAAIAAAVTAASQVAANAAAATQPRDDALLRQLQQLTTALRDTVTEMRQSRTLVLEGDVLAAALATWSQSAVRSG